MIFSWFQVDNCDLRKLTMPTGKLTMQCGSTQSNVESTYHTEKVYFLH